MRIKKHTLKKTKSGSKESISIGLYLILLVFFIILSSNSTMNPRKIQYVAKKLAPRNNAMKLKTTIFATDFSGKSYIRKEILEFTDFVKTVTEATIFVTKKEITLQFDKQSFFNEDGFVSEKVYDEMEIILDKLESFKEQYNIKANLSFLIESTESNIEKAFLDLTKIRGTVAMIKSLQKEDNFGIRLIKQSFEEDPQVEIFIVLDPQSNNT